MILRSKLIDSIEIALNRNPVTAILGPRQCGKTTVARSLCSMPRRENSYFDLEDPSILESFQNPMTLLRDLTGIIVIDEIQRRPDLFPALRVLADREPSPAKFLVLGSASPDLIRQSSESLAGRVEFVEMSGFYSREVGTDMWRKLWWRGGFPRSFLAEADADSSAWREQFVRTFMERDLAQLGLSMPPLMLRRFWTMVAHYHGQTWNSSEVAASMGINDHTSRRYLDILAGAYMIRLLPPWHENISKRQRRMPKVYFRDTGILHSLLGISDSDSLLSHPKCGASWEGFALEEILRIVPSRDAFYWAVHSGPELDLLIFRNNRRIGFEFKFADAPKLTPSMQDAMRHLSLDHLWVVYPGNLRYALTDGIEALPFSACQDVIA